MPNPSSSLPAIRIRGRSFLALVLTPTAPLLDWLNALDAQLEKSTHFFFGKPVILNLELLSGNEENLEHLYGALSHRNIQVISIERGSKSWEALSKWPQTFIFAHGKDVDHLTLPNDPPQKTNPVPSHIIDEPVRSGQSILFPEGDVIITNSVASGAEIVAGGSIHVYGALRGRAVAGISGQPQARIFALQMEAELLAIDGYYMTAEEIPEEFLTKPTQVTLDNDAIIITALSKVK